MASPNPQESSDAAPEIVDEDAVEQKDNGLILKFEPFKLEEIIKYEPGGYHPVHLGDVLDDRYRMVHKLGQGGFATVWLARDSNAKDTTKYVALKIIRADSSGDDCPELLLDRLAGEMGEKEGSKYLSFPLDRFKVVGPNGSHLCFVYPVMGPRVSYGVFRASDDLDEILRRVCYGVTVAIASLHHQGICHGGKKQSALLP